MFLHRINWPRTGCISFQKNVMQHFVERWNQNHKEEFYGFFHFDKHCKSGFSEDVEKLSRESTNWNCFLTSFHFLLWKLATISIPSASFKIPTSTNFSISQKCVMYSPNLNIFHKRPFHDVCPHLDHHWLMRKVELSHKTSVKSLQGNKKHNIILLPAPFFVINCSKSHRKLSLNHKRW